MNGPPSDRKEPLNRQSETSGSMPHAVRRLTGRVCPANTTAAIIALAGTLLYALFAFSLLQNNAYPFFGTDIYDRYFLALTEGRFDLPATVLRYEGHYAPDGTGYLYHGLAPLITRVLFGWFLPLETVSLAPISIWLWTTVGSLLQHKLFYNLTVHYWPQGRDRVFWSICLSLMVWITTPGILLSANTALYHESVAVGYAASAGFVYLLARFHLLGKPLSHILLPAALVAAVSLHARPNLAIGLFAGVSLLVILCILKDRLSSLLPCLLAMAVLGASGIGYMAFNAARFGNIGVTHGSFTEGGVLYGKTFWAGETETNSKRAKAFAEHGRFNAERILPNLALYAFDPPRPIFGAALSDKFEKIYRTVTLPVFGFVRLEGPRIGFVFLWLPWLLVPLIAMAAGGLRSFADGWLLLLATGIAAALTLSYGTITLRYRADLWPFFSALAAVSWPAIAPGFAAFGQSSRRMIAMVVLAISIFFSLGTAIAYQQHFQEVPGSFFAPWSIEDCRQRAESRLLDSSNIDRICAP
ncbi:MAG: hypothetical protein C4548_13305 [Desulfobacteraceae bacterium]|nr:MAG: hypothetical protein C4548_13305 [Desulfobacteraceae bacterium]